MSARWRNGDRPLLVGTRGSALARAQTEEVLARLRRAAPEVRSEVRIITTYGDRDRSALLSVIGGAGVFAKELQRALLDHSIDVAVHSLKDLPPAPAAGLITAAVPPRADPRDALVSRDGLSLHHLPPGARVGTGSARRAAFLHALRPDLEVVEIRGNVDSRISKVLGDGLDAVVLAAAGLTRLGRSRDAVEVFPPEVMTPAPGQGALSLETRENDRAVRELIALLDDPDSHDCVDAERAFLARLGAGCALPVGAYATARGDTIELQGMIAATLIGPVVVRTVAGPRSDPGALGEQLATEILAEINGPAT